jgi:hypothetical protein
MTFFILKKDGIHSAIPLAGAASGAFFFIDQRHTLLLYLLFLVIQKVQASPIGFALLFSVYHLATV